MDYLIGLVTETSPATLDFFELFSEIKNAYINFLPRIQEERPNIMENLLKMRDSIEENKKQGIKAGFPNR